MTSVKKWEIFHILDRSTTVAGQQPTVDVIASIVEPKFANTLVRRLNQIIPLEDLRHVKRVQKRNSVEAGKVQLSVILCLSNEDENQLENIPNDLLDLVNAYLLSPFVTKVPKYAPVTKEEWLEQCKLWPTSFHPPTYSIDGITGFSEEDSESIFNFMKMALKLTKFGSHVVNSAVVVDPSVRQVISIATDQACSHQIQTNGTGLETEGTKQSESIDTHLSDSNRESNHADEQKHSYPGVSCLYPWKWTVQQRSSGSTSSWHPLRHAALVAIEYAAARDRNLFPVSGNSQDHSVEVDRLQSLKNLPAKRQKTHLLKDEADVVSNDCSNGFGSDIVRPYLCTGFDIFLVWEPCIMCAMALVHQRIRRIFYAFPNPNAGALGSVQRLQGEKSLNHHYAVFRVLLPSESS